MKLPGIMVLTVLTCAHLCSCAHVLTGCRGCLTPVCHPLRPANPLFFAGARAHASRVLATDSCLHSQNLQWRVWAACTGTETALGAPTPSFTNAHCHFSRKPKQVSQWVCVGLALRVRGDEAFRTMPLHLPRIYLECRVTQGRSNGIDREPAPCGCI